MWTWLTYTGESNSSTPAANNNLFCLTEKKKNSDSLFFYLSKPKQPFLATTCGDLLRFSCFSYRRCLYSLDTKGEKILTKKS